jgi:hypothetical protein
MRIQNSLLQSLSIASEIRSKSRGQAGYWNQPAQVRSNPWKDHLTRRTLEEISSILDDPAEQQGPYYGRGRLLGENAGDKRVQ